MKPLKSALIHFRVKHKQPEENRRRFAELVTEAAAQDAEIVIGPEMAVSGYSFDNRSDIAPYAETENGPTMTVLADAARKHGIHICIGIAEKDVRTGILYNSAFVLGSDGNLLCRYRKINAESRWACSGDPKQDNTFETPWGRMGVLICSDSYHGLMPRVTALRGADLLMVPSNWPPSDFDPRELWRARAMENGFYLAACNRTGIDLTMDCREAASCVFDPWGRMLVDGEDEDSKIVFTDLPLTPAGRLDDEQRLRRMANRQPQYYGDCCLNLQMIRDPTGFLNLPAPGALNMNCIVPDGSEHPVDALKSTVSGNGSETGGLFLLPSFAYSDTAVHEIEQVVESRNICVVTRNSVPTGHRYYAFQGKDDVRQWSLPDRPQDDDANYPRIDFGTARLLLIPFAALAHPETAVAGAKQGCDMALASEGRLSPEHRLLAGARSIENLSVAVCASNEAGIWITPSGHRRWEEVSAKQGEICRYTLDTWRMRKKRFQDRIDFETLLNGENLKSE